MTCKECAHYQVCAEDNKDFVCEFFKDEANIVELPCKIGDEVWCIRSYNGHKSHPQKGKVAEMYFADDMRLVVHVKHIGRGFWNDRIFATEEEALENIMKEGGEE